MPSARSPGALSTPACADCVQIVCWPCAGRVPPRYDGKVCLGASVPVMTHTVSRASNAGVMDHFWYAASAAAPTTRSPGGVVVFTWPIYPW